MAVDIAAGPWRGGVAKEGEVQGGQTREGGDNERERRCVALLREAE